MQLTLLDWSLIALYMVVVVAVGLLFRGRAGKSLEEYFVSGRALPWWLAGTSMVATTFAADTPLAVTSLVVKNGLAGNWTWWSFAMGGMLTVFVFSRYWRRAEVITDVELIALRYAGRPALALRVTRGLYWALLVNPIIIGWVCGGMLTVMEETVFYQSGSEAAKASGFWTPINLAWATLLAMFAFTALYSSLSGLWGVVVTDMIQFVIAMGGCIWLAIVAYTKGGGGAELARKVGENFSSGKGTEAEGINSALAYLPSLTESSWMPLHIFLIILIVQWWATCYPGAEPGGGGYIVQRMASCRSERDSFLAALWYQLAHYCLRPWPWIVVALFALANFPELRENYLKDSSYDPGKGYAMAMRELCTPGLAGIMVVVFFAAFMSTLSTQINWAASYLVRDFLQPLYGKDASEKKLAGWSRWASVLIVVESLGVAAWMKLSGVSIDEAWKLLMALGSGTGLVLILRWFWWRINAWSEISAMLISLVLYLLSNQSFVYQGWLGREAPLKSEEQILFIALGTIVGWLLVTYLTKPEPLSHLRAFYRKVRPWSGGWGPVADAEKGVPTDRNLGWAILAAACGAGLVYFALPLVGSLLFPQMPVSRVTCGIGFVGCAIALSVLTVRLLDFSDENTP